MKKYGLYYLSSSSILLLLRAATSMKSVESRFVIRRGAWSKTLETAAYVYYGRPSVTVNSTVIYLTSDEACNLKNTIAVKNQIVVSGVGSCLMHTRYKNMMKAGAIGYVEFVPWKPGLYTYRRESWQAVTTDHQMAIVSSHFNYFDDAYVNEEWLRGSTATIGPPHDTSMEDMYNSVWWTFFFRVIEPSCAFFVFFACCDVVCTAMLSKWDPRRVARSKIGISLCFCEALPMLVLGTLGVFDVNGKSGLPFEKRCTT